MNSFEAIGQARLSAAEGQQILARMLAQSVSRAFRRMTTFLLNLKPAV